MAWDEHFVPSDFKFALFRTTWNYFDEINNFMVFLNNCKNSISLINSHDLIFVEFRQAVFVVIERSRG